MHMHTHVCFLTSHIHNGNTMKTIYDVIYKCQTVCIGCPTKYGIYSIYMTTYLMMRYITIMGSGRFIDLWLAIIYREDSIVAFCTYISDLIIKSFICAVFKQVELMCSYTSVNI